MPVVMVFGAFDLLHQGHRDFFAQAQKYGDKLVIVVARNSTIKKIKGRVPFFSEIQRARAVRQTKIGSRILLGDKKDPYKIIRKIKPDVICLGYDQNSFVKNLRQTFPEIKIVRLKPYQNKIFKSSKLKRKLYA